MNLKILFKATKDEVEAFKAYMQETGYMCCENETNKKSDDFSVEFFWFRDASGKLDINYELACFDHWEDGPVNYIGIRYEDI